MVDDKRGQQMSLSTIIVIVLGIVVLVFLIFGFSTGWSNLWNKITNIGGTSNNVDVIVQACALRCSTGDEYGFCQEVRRVNYGDKTWQEGSCYGLSLNENKAGIESCSIDCGVSANSYVKDQTTDESEAEMARAAASTPN